MVDDEKICKGPPWYDGYLFLYPPSVDDENDDDFEAIVRSRPKIRPGYMLTGSKYKAFVPLCAASWDAFDAKVTRLVGERHVALEVLKAPADPHALHSCPIKRNLLGLDDCLAFALVTVNSVMSDSVMSDAVDEAIQAIRSALQGIPELTSLAERMDGIAPILVELQGSATGVKAGIAAILDKNTVSPRFVYGHSLGVTNPVCPS